MTSKTYIRKGKTYAEHIAILEKKLTAKKYQPFIKWYRDKWDVQNVVGIDPRLAIRVYKDYKETIADNVRWTLIVGPGGSGKTTASMNICYTLDKKFNADMIVTDWVDLAKIMSKLPTLKARRAILMDEPDLKIHPLSKQGKFIASILNKARQQQLFLVFCSTSLKIIQPFLFEKIQALGYCPNKGDIEFYRDNYEKNLFMLTGIRKKYTEFGYRVFKQYRGMKLHTYNYIPLSKEEMDRYIKNKSQDYDANISAFIQLAKKDTSLVGDKRVNDVKRYYKIKGLKEAGKTIAEIAAGFGFTPSRIYQIIKKHKMEGL